MKKIIAIILIAAFAFMILAACGEDADNTDNNNQAENNQPQNPVEEAPGGDNNGEENQDLNSGNDNDDTQNGNGAENPANDSVAAEWPGYIEFDLVLYDQWNLIVAQLLPLTAGNTYEIGIRYRGPDGLRMSAYNAIDEDDFVFINLDPTGSDWVEATMSLTTVHTKDYAVYVLNYDPAHGELVIDEIWLYDAANPGVNLLVNGNFENNSNFINNSADIFGVIEVGETQKWFVLEWALK